MFGRKRPEPAPPPIRATLFGDLPLGEWCATTRDADADPWPALMFARDCVESRDLDAARTHLRRVLEFPRLESRHYLQVWSALRQLGDRPTQSQARSVLGVVVEMALPEGLDLLACYRDHTARYYNYAGGAVVWEHADGSLDATIDAVLAAAESIMPQLGPWAGERPGPPPAGQARLSFLSPGGLYFGQAPPAVLQGDQQAGPVLIAATALMRAVIEKAR